MAEDRQPGPGFGGNGLVLLIAAAASALYVGWQRPMLESSRPTDPDHQMNEIRSKQDVEARLWQDPFAAIAREREDRKNNKQAELPLDHSVEVFNGPKTLFLGVTLPGTSYSEAAETRRRLRYAILSALHVAKYEPADEKHLGYLLLAGGPADPGNRTTTPRPEAKRTAVPRMTDGTVHGVAKHGEAAAVGDEAAEPKAAIPFEVFIPRYANQDRQITVLWLDEDRLSAGRTPLANLRGLLCQLNLGKRKFTLIGPQDSTTLTAMAWEIAHRQSDKQPLQAPCHDGHSPISTRLPLYNFGATADEKAVLYLAGLDKGDIEKTSIQEHFKTGYIDYYPTIGTDQALAETIARELVRRGVETTLSVRRPHSHDDAIEVRRDHIALISEWDTVYGENLPDSMEREFDRGFVHAGEGPASARQSIERFSYLRGLDGRLPHHWGKKDPKSSGDEAPPTSPQGSTIADHTSELESAEGQSQFDYLRRLAERIRQRDDELRLNGAGRIAAIGVLGSDVYDKLLILQALRSDFPDALFFTTDLDALLLPQKKGRYTRNLLVASSYDLKLNDALQADVPPFRSSYQTSVFLTTRLAVRNAWSHHPANETADKTRGALQCWLSQPLLFQIGRSAPKALFSGPESQPSSATEDPCAHQRDRQAAGMLSYPSVHPPVAALFPLPGSRALVGAGLLLTVLLLTALFGSSRVRHLYFPNFAFRPQSRPYFQPRIGPLVLLLLVTLIAALGLCISWPSIGRFLTQDRFGEPMALLEGISIWPTVALRAIGCVFSVWMIFYALKGLERNKEATEKQMGVYDKCAPLGKQIELIDASQRSRTGRVAAMVIGLLWFPPEKTKDYALGDDGRPKVWFRELSGGYSGSWQARSVRAAVGTVAMMLIWSLILVPIFGMPNVPARGSLARAIYHSVTMAEVIATLFLIFVVADAAIYSSVFIKRLTAVNTDWPEETVRRYEHRFNLKSDGLGDWLDMQFLAMRTDYITWLIYFPFLALALLIASRSQLFADYSTPATLLIAQAISLVVIVGSVVVLRSAAEKARDTAREHLTAKIILAKGVDEKAAAQLEMLLAQVSDLKKGAFAPLSSQPVVKALLLPLLSYGATVLIHSYAIPGF